MKSAEGTLRERAIALAAVDLTIRSAAVGASATIGELAQRALVQVATSELEGEQGLDTFYEGFVRDPDCDPDGDPMDPADEAALAAWRAEQEHPPVAALSALLSTSDYRGDHAADVLRAFAVEPGETVQALVSRLLEVGPHAPKFRSNAAPDVRVDHIEIRLVAAGAVVTQTGRPDEPPF